MAKMTQEGYDKLNEELQNLENIEKPKIAGILKEAISQGDLSENFAYQDGKERQRKLEEKISLLKEEIRNAEIESTTNTNFVQMGSSITVETESGEEKKYKITGREETDPMQGKISYDSPMGEAFLDCSKGDTVDVKTPAGTKQYKIKSIE